MGVPIVGAHTCYDRRVIMTIVILILLLVIILAVGLDQSAVIEAPP
jgi:hypothetical protein